VIDFVHKNALDPLPLVKKYGSDALRLALFDMYRGQKDFVFSDYQVYEAAANGADALLLIIAILEPDQYAELLALSVELGLGVLVEVFTEGELEVAMIEDPTIVGINNRNLKTLVTTKNQICQDNAVVFQSHNYEISKLGNDFCNIAHSETCKNEIFQHNNLDIFGTQFHPEMTKDGQDMIKKFTSL